MNGRKLHAFKRISGASKYMFENMFENEIHLFLLCPWSMKTVQLTNNSYS